MRKHTSTYCNDTGHLIAILDGAFNYRTVGQLIFLGKFYKGVRENDKCIVKLPKSRSWTATECQANVNTFKEVHKWSKLGRKELNFRVSVHVPTMVRLRKVTKWFRKQVNYPVGEGHFVLIEELVEGQRQEFIDRDGKEQSNCPLELHEFLHYTYHRSDGQLVACDFHGVSDGNAVHLSEPTIHSESRSFGASDDGPSGIRRVFQNHTCSKRCRNWKLPELEKKVPVPGRLPSQTDVMDVWPDNQNKNHPYTCHHCKCPLPSSIPTDDLPPSYYSTDTFINMLPGNQTQRLLQEHHLQHVHLNPHHAPQHVPLHTTCPQPHTQQGHHVLHITELQWANSLYLQRTAPPPYEL